MEERVKKEIEYYDRAGQALKEPAVFNSDEVVDFEGFRPLKLASFRYCYELLKRSCAGKKVLDWGCGNGVHTIPIARMASKKIIGIDLSEELLKMAREKSRKSGLADKIDFLKMDCEKTDFLNDEFDVIFDGGTFSSIDISKAFPELARILKPNGVLVGIETYGHNPYANFKRALNVKSGKRTAWAAAHIFNEAGLALAHKYFGKIEIRYFHLFSWVLFPFVGISWGARALDFIDPIDNIIIKIPFLRKYAFKVVFKFSNPIKNV